MTNQSRGLGGKNCKVTNAHVCHCNKQTRCPIFLSRKAENRQRAQRRMGEFSFGIMTFGRREYHAMRSGTNKINSRTAIVAGASALAMGVAEFPRSP